MVQPFRRLARVPAAVLALCAAAGAARAEATVQPTPAPTEAPSKSPPQIPQTAGATAAPAPAATPDFTVAFNVGVASQYVFRGVSQTDGDVQGFAGVDFGYKQLYLGSWISNVDFAPFGDTRTSAEIDLYGGWKPEPVAGVALDLGFIYYGYAGQPRGGPSVDYIEGYVKATKAFGPVTAGASVFYSPDFTGETGDGVYYEGNLAWAINKKVSLSGAVARQEIQKVAGYTTWNLGGTYALTDKISVDLRYYDTDEHRFGKPYDSRVVVALKAVI